MKNLKHIITSQILAVVTLIVVTGLASVADAYERKSIDANNVRVEIVPIQLSPGQQIKFKIRMQTHSVELSHDMVSVSILKDDNGREYRPLNWNGSPPSGHHRSGVLEFPALTGKPTAVTLVIKDIANVPERTFQWKVKP